MRGFSICFLALVGLSRASFAAYPCEFDVYRPGALFTELQLSLRAEGVTILPPEFTVAGLPAHRMNILQAGGVVGQALLTGDVRRGSAALTVFDTRSTVLAHATYRQFPCPERDPRGMCEEIIFGTEIGVTAAGGPAFVLRYGADTSGVEGYRYGKLIPNFLWRAEFRDAFAWLVGTLARPSEVFGIKTTTLKERLLVALASDPLVADYILDLRIVESARSVKVYGRVPSNAVYSAIVSRAIAAGIYHIQPMLVIDTRMARPFYDELTLTSCRRP